MKQQEMFMSKDLAVSEFLEVRPAFPFLQETLRHCNKCWIFGLERRMFSPDDFREGLPARWKVYAVKELD